MNETISAFFENDHREIDAILERTAFDSPSALSNFSAFNARLERHIRWEEELLFPAVAAKAPPLAMGPIRVMKLEHQAIREHKAATLAALKAGDAASAKAHSEAMVQVLTGHNHKEEAVLYPACDQMLASEAQALLAKLGA